MKFGCKKPLDRINTRPTSLWESPNTSFGSRWNGVFGEKIKNKKFYPRKLSGAAFLLMLRLTYPNWWNREKVK